jgi:hypothetical protein
VLSCQRLTLGLLATITLEVVPFHAYALLLELMSFFKCILEVMFCESVQHVCDSVSIISVVSELRLFQFYLRRGKQESGVVGDDSQIVFGKKFRGEIGSVLRCVVVMQ